MTTDPPPLPDALRRLVTEVRIYIDRPGCNIPARQTALNRLGYAADQAERALAAAEQQARTDSKPAS